MTPYYQDNWITLYQADCLEVTRAMPDASIDAVLTDPPFSSGGRRENSRSLRVSMNRSTDNEEWIRGDAMSTGGFTYMMRMCGMQWRRILKPGGHALSFIDWRMDSYLEVALESADLRQHPTLIWDKTHFGMGDLFRNQYEMILHFSAGKPRPPQRRDVGNVIPCPPVRGGDHPTEKPEALLRTVLSVVTPPGGVVLDPFAGSGATLFAARALGCRSIGIELDERFCEAMARRAAQTVLELPPPPAEAAQLGMDGL